MIKHFTYSCDGGTIMLGNETSRVCLPNGYGDGEHRIEIRDIEDKDYSARDNMTWLGTVQGNNIHVYDYDCLHGEALTSKEHILCTLVAGRWAVYCKQGNILLEQWD